MKRILMGIAMTAACSAVAAPPVVSNVTLAQPQNTRLAVVGYETDGVGIATFQLKTNGVDICHSEIVRSVTGGISKLLPAGAHEFTWDAGRDFPENLVSNLTVEVTLWATNNPPTYCAVNLVQENGQYAVRWYGKESEVPFGVNHSWWKKDWLLLRKMPSTEGEFVTLGAPPGELGRDNTRDVQRNVRFTKPFYMGVFEVTQRQWQQVMGTRPSYFNNSNCYEERPVEQVTFNTVRGTVAQGCNWPADGHAVHSASFMGVLRARAGGLLEFDLPTEGQWEYACRAGSSGSWNNGTTITNGTADANLDLLGRYTRNGGYVLEGTSWVPPPRDCTDEHGTAKVGSYLPNAWGLYDMHGNVWEFCLDWIVTSGADPSLAGDDPTGPAQTSGSRTDRGGGWSYAAQHCRAARRGSSNVSATYTEIGLRVAAPAEVLVSE
ncbi:MAG: formylglycine-generating enzyme family protein [Kiritimatiellaeota bacterium]|nr:formylglycine-generating enzyme family protein [Kiritimatiellota bacterium]